MRKDGKRPLKLEPQPWIAKAACSGLVDLYFPGRAGNTTVRVRALCRSCPVKAECLEYALSLPSWETRSGIWAGLSYRSLQLERARRAKIAS